MFMKVCSMFALRKYWLLQSSHFEFHLLCIIDIYYYNVISTLFIRQIGKAHIWRRDKESQPERAFRVNLDLK